MNDWLNDWHSCWLPSNCNINISVWLYMLVRVVDRVRQADEFDWWRSINSSVELLFRAVRRHVLWHGAGENTWPVRLDSAQWRHQVRRYRSPVGLSWIFLRLHRGQRSTPTWRRSMVSFSHTFNDASGYCVHSKPNYELNMNFSGLCLQ